MPAWPCSSTRVTSDHFSCEACCHETHFACHTCCAAQALTKNGTEGATWETVKVMRPVAAAVMDSGVDCFHRDLNVVYNRSFLNLRDEGSQPSDLQACWDVYDHGTNVAGAC
jgi:hypothetical protein